MSETTSANSGARSLDEVCAAARTCTLCAEHLPLGPRPVFVARATARLLLIGQAPGTRVHASGVPWDDASGRTLREWMGIDDTTFYEHRFMAIVPSGLCYPGKGRNGDLPPRPECAPLWLPQFRAVMPDVRLTLAIGRYAHSALLDLPKGQTLSDTVADWERVLGTTGCFPLPHPSPRNRRWIAQRPWFTSDVLPALKQRVLDVLEMPQSICEAPVMHS